MGRKDLRLAGGRKLCLSTYAATSYALFLQYRKIQDSPVDKTIISCRIATHKKEGIMNKVVVLGLLFAVGCSAAKPEVKTVENVTTKSSAETFVDRIEKINPFLEDISIEYDEGGNIKVFSCRGCHIECKHCVE